MHVFYIVTLNILMGNQQICLFSPLSLLYITCTFQTKTRNELYDSNKRGKKTKDSGNGGYSPLNCKNGCQREYQKQILIIYHDYCRNVIHLERDIKPSPKSILVHSYKISCHLQHGLCVLLFHLLCSCFTNI